MLDPGEPFSGTGFVAPAETGAAKIL